MAISELPLLSLIALLFLMLTNNVHSQDTTSFAFESFVPNPKDLTYQGGAHVPPGSSILRLTKIDDEGKPATWSVGRVVYSKPVHLWKRSSARQAAFETTIRFAITPSRNGAADGIAFFMAPVDTAIPSDSSGPYLGIFNSSGTSPSLFAVEFDTYVNPEWDPSYRHIGVDINSVDSRNVTRFNSATGGVVTAFINYRPETGVLSVAAASGSQYSTLTYVYDLKNILPEWVQVGISSSTGRYVSYLGIHDIHSWYFTSTLVPTDVNDDGKKKATYIR